MKRIHLIISVVAIALVGIFVFSKLFFIGKKLEISFVKAQRHSQSDLAYKGCVNDFEWKDTRFQQQELMRVCLRQRDSLEQERDC